MPQSDLIILLVVLSLLLASAIVLLVLFLWKSKGGKEKEKTKKKETTAPLKETGEETSPEEAELPLSPLPEEEVPKDQMIEIKDKRLLSLIETMIPGFATTSEALKEAFDKPKKVAYQTVVPAKGKPVKKYSSKENFKDPSKPIYFLPYKMTIPLTPAAGLHSAMSLASWVVGTYYLNKIHSQLDTILANANKISDFQDNEYRSKVFSLLTHIRQISDFQEEILVNDDLRKDKIRQLSSLEEEDTSLLGQANLMLVSSTKKNRLTYKEYVAETKTLDNYYTYQEILLDLLYQCANLTYTLYLGEVSRKQCNALLPTYTEQSKEARDRVQRWHSENAKRLSYDLKAKKVRREGLNRMVHLVPGLFHKEKNYTDMEEEVVSEIVTQNKPLPVEKGEEELFSEDVTLISYEGKVYYLPKEEKKQEKEKAG